MINNKNIHDKNNDVPVAGTDLFADSEDFLNELTDSDLGQIVGGSAVKDTVNDVQQTANDLKGSHLSILAC